ncbi:MAG: DinB family protein [Phycisphaerales bacterium]
MDRASLLKWWNDAWTEGLWAAPWKKAVEGLTPAQAAWSPAAGRHSIWTIVEHMLFWREDNLRRLAGGGPATNEQVAAGNFPRLADTSGAAWQATLRRFEESHRRIAAAIADPALSLERVAYLLPHDAYHVGQIMYLRALQGLPPIE